VLLRIGRNVRRLGKTLGSVLPIDGKTNHLAVLLRHQL
jgi:hypothetical protein